MTTPSADSGTSEPPGAVELGANEAAIFGYGSLLSIPSLERTLGRAYDRPFVPCRLSGWRRAWNVVMPNQTFYYEGPDGRVYPRSICYLNAERAVGGSMNGVLFVVTGSELLAFDRREWIYDRVDASGDLRGARVEGGGAYVYVAKPEFVMNTIRTPEEAAIRASYVKILKSGLESLGHEFRTAYLQSSQPLPEHLVVEDIRDAGAPNPFEGTPTEARGGADSAPDHA